ncbi:MAG: hypothetical protein KDD34_06910, partial [Bdellovibrionales bacterium]|nr:hypothetical protein [Bdellovibrionales bacterium]
MFLSHASLGASFDPGFIDTNDQKIPLEVKESTDRIFQIQVPYYERVGSSLNKVGNIMGTAFVDKDPEYIWTNCHIVRTW